MNEHQNGFRTGHSFLSQLLPHHEKVLKAMELGIDVDVIYLNLPRPSTEWTTAYSSTRYVTSVYVD